MGSIDKGRSKWLETWSILSRTREAPVETWCCMILVGSMVRPAQLWLSSKTRKRSMMDSKSRFQHAIQRVCLAFDIRAARDKSGPMKLNACLHQSRKISLLGYTNLSGRQGGASPRVGELGDEATAAEDFDAPEPARRARQADDAGKLDGGFG